MTTGQPSHPNPPPKVWRADDWDRRALAGLTPAQRDAAAHQLDQGLARLAEAIRQAGPPPGGDGEVEAGTVTRGRRWTRIPYKGWADDGPANTNPLINPAPPASDRYEYSSVHHRAGRLRRWWLTAGRRRALLPLGVVAMAYSATGFVLTAVLPPPSAAVTVAMTITGVALFVSMAAVLWRARRG